MTQVRIHHRDWILVGDGKKALLLINEGDAELLNLRKLSVTAQDDPPTHEQGSDRPGRHFSSVSPGRSAYEQADWHTLDETRFAQEIAARLNRAIEEGAVDRLILVAPPKILGALRAALSAKAHEKIVGEFPKDLTGHPIPEIEQILSAQKG